jgi:hypothetical protein
MDPVLEGALTEFERWRKIRKSGERIPESLWEAAVGLTQRYTISQVSRWLRLNYTELRKRSHGSSKQGLGCSQFIQLDTAEVFSAGECIIEMRRRGGAKAVVHAAAGPKKG